MWRDGPGNGVYMLIYEGYSVFTQAVPCRVAEQITFSAGDIIFIILVPTILRNV
jgi:hypothetical protein